MIQFLLSGDQRCFSDRVELGSSGSAENLQNIQQIQIPESARCRVPQRRAFDDHVPGGQIHAPRERRRTHEHAGDPFLEQIFGQRSVGPQHACVVHGDARLDQRVKLLLHARPVLRHRVQQMHLPGIILPGRQEIVPALVMGHLHGDDVDERFGGLDGVVPGMDENHHLLALLEHLENLFGRHFVERVGAAFRDARDRLLQRDGPVRGVEEERVLLRHPEECGNVVIIGKGGR